MKAARNCVRLPSLPSDASSLAQVRPDIYAKVFHPSGVGEMPWPLWKLQVVKESIPMRSNDRVLSKRKADASSEFLQMAMVWKTRAEIEKDKTMAKYQKQIASAPSLTPLLMYKAAKEANTNAAIKAKTKAANPGLKGESSPQLATCRCIAKANSYS